MNDSFFRENLEENKVSLEDDTVVQDKKIFSKIEKRFSNDTVNAKIVILVGILAIVLGSWHLFSGIKNAFVFSPIVLEDKSGVIENLNSIKDTDSDGISDYDERYIYGTSPYLADTDSDGISDYDEILAGQEPLCTGDECISDNQEDSNVSELYPLEKISLDDLKSELIKAGYSPEEVNKLSEEDLNFIYAEAEKSINNEDYVYPSMNTGREEGSVEESTPSAEELEQLQNLSIDQIKELLIQGGVTTEQLESVSDKDLRKIYLETLQSLQ